MSDDEENELSTSEIATGSESDAAKKGHQRQRSRFASLDLETGKPLDEKGSAKVKVMSTREACGSLQRRRSEIKKDFKKAVSPLRKRKTRRRPYSDELDREMLTSTGSFHGRLMVEASHIYGEGRDSESSRSDETVRMQYRLSAQQPRNSKFYRLLKFFGITVGPSGVLEDSGGGENSGCLCFGLSLNRFVTTYLNWTFRASFPKVLLSAAFGFYCLTLFFALLIFASGNNHPDCVHVNGYNFGQPHQGDRFADAYALSWTTFSTVGYGLVFPSTTATVDGHHRRCTGIQILCTFESFVGILFASFCGAIVFGKVARTRSHAQVTFSDPIVVRYGKGAKEEDSDSSSDEEEQVGRDPTVQLNCPVLEFRVINRLHSTKSGEIMDATMNVVASIDECQACNSVRVSPRNNKRRRGKRRALRPSVNARAGIPRTVSEQESLHSLQSASTDDSQNTMDPSLHPRAKAYQVDDEEAVVDGETVSRRIFSKIELETPDHPFFKRVWTASHVLNEHSPLLTMAARRMVRDNNGFWPVEMNNHESVRESVNFHQILVSLSGTSNADANTVYAQKVYDYVDMNVGYRFVNVLYRNPRDGCIAVDPSLVNDVLEQSGGGAEPLTYDEGDRHTRRILVL